MLSVIKKNFIETQILPVFKTFSLHVHVHSTKIIILEDICTISFQDTHFQEGALSKYSYIAVVSWSDPDQCCLKVNPSGHW